LELEQLLNSDVLDHEGESLAYPFAIPFLKGTDLPYIEPLAMWAALLGDLILKTPLPLMAVRFHRGLAKVICAMAQKLTDHEGRDRTISHVALSGGVFQNEVLLGLVTTDLKERGFTVLSHRQVPSNDGGLALGQAIVAAARALSNTA
jgi:hydrogenase maturation protein HypF